MHGISQYLDACQQRFDFLNQQMAWLQQERADHDGDAEHLKQTLDRSREEMAGYLIPEVSDEFLAELENRLAYPGLLPIKRDFEQRFEAAEQRRVELEAMDDIKMHDYSLRAVNEKIDDQHPAYDKVRSDIAYWNHNKSHRKLEKRGYYKSDYRAGLFRRFFDWRDVSFLMTALKKTAGLDFQHPSELREHFRELSDRAKRITVAYEMLGEERDRILALKQEHDEVLAAPEQLLAKLYQSLGQAAVTHLLACPQETRFQLVQQDRNLTTFLKKEAGLKKQIQYLNELAVSTVDSRMQALNMELNKLDDKICKLEGQQRRGKRKFYSDDDLQRVRNVKAEKWEKRQLKTAKLRNRIKDFRDYDSGSCEDDYLWWDVITRGAHTDAIFEVREHRQQNPDWDYRTHRDPFDGDGLLHDDDGTDRLSAMDSAADALASSMATDNDNDLFDPS